MLGAVTFWGNPSRALLLPRNADRNVSETPVRYSGVVTERTKELETGAGRYRAAAWLAWSLAALSVAMFVAAVVLFCPRRICAVPGQLLHHLRIQRNVELRALPGLPIVGAILTSRRPGNPIGPILLADGLLWTSLAVTDTYSVYGVTSPGSVPFPVAIGTIGNQWLWVPTVGLLGIYLILLFPDGKLPSLRWRPLALVSAVMIMLLSITEGLAPGPFKIREG